MVLAVLAGVVLLAFANGANDTFKGVATIHGGGVSSYRWALIWATVCTFAGCLAAAWLADGLAVRFSGRGFLPDPLIDSRVAMAISVASAFVVLGATAIGMPVSTTHAILGALTGTSIYLQGWALPWETLLMKFAVPLALSPAVSLTVSWLAVRFVPSTPSCICMEPVPTATGSAVAAIVIDAERGCEARGATKLVSGRSAMTGLHFLSAGSVSLARGLNDVPKIAGILLATSFLEWNGWMLAGLGLIMALGGILGSARVAKTMSREITPMNDAQGLMVNLVTSGLVFGASMSGVPVSTTHVTCGALAGLGLQTRRLARRRFAQILLAWFVTLPAAALIAVALLWLF